MKIPALDEKGISVTDRLPYQMYPHDPENRDWIHDKKVVRPDSDNHMTLDGKNKQCTFELKPLPISCRGSL